MNPPGSSALQNTINLSVPGGKIKPFWCLFDHCSISYIFNQAWVTNWACLTLTRGLKRGRYKSVRRLRYARFRIGICPNWSRLSFNFPRNQACSLQIQGTPRAIPDVAARVYAPPVHWPRLWMLATQIPFRTCKNTQNKRKTNKKERKKNKTNGNYYVGEWRSQMSRMSCTYHMSGSCRLFHTSLGLGGHCPCFDDNWGLGRNNLSLQTKTKEWYIQYGSKLEKCLIPCCNPKPSFYPSLETTRPSDKERCLWIIIFLFRQSDQENIHIF